MNYVLKPETAFEAAPASMLGGVEILKGTTERIIAENDFKEIKSVTDSILLIPYYARSHRGNGEMAVWLPSDENILKDQLKERARITDKVLSVKKVRKLRIS